MKILIPVSGAADAKLILDFVANHMWPPASEFRVMHILDSPAMSTASESISEDLAARELVKSVKARIDRLVRSSETVEEVVHGPPVGTILETAKAWAPNMIVMGYRTRSTGDRFLAGSVSRTVSMHAPCSVVVVRPPEMRTVGDATKATEFGRNDKRLVG